MNKKIIISLITFSGIVTVLTGGIEDGVIYALQMISISLCLRYVSAKKKNYELDTVV